MNQQHKDALSRAVGRMVVGMMQEVMTLPDEFRPDATSSTSFKSVDGHEWTVSVEWCGFTGPGTLPKAEG